MVINFQVWVNLDKLQTYIKCDYLAEGFRQIYDFHLQVLPEWPMPIVQQDLHPCWNHKALHRSSLLNLIPFLPQNHPIYLPSICSQKSTNQIILDDKLQLVTALKESWPSLTKYFMLTISRTPPTSFSDSCHLHPFTSWILVSHIWCHLNIHHHPTCPWHCHTQILPLPKVVWIQTPTLS